MTDKIIARLTGADEVNLTAVMEGLRRGALHGRDRFPTRTKALRLALQLAADHYAAVARVEGDRAHG